jgi:hypothetical protein
MTTRTSTDPERALKRGGDELEERLHRVDDDIDEAKKQLHAQRESGLRGAAGEWEDTDDDAGGEDPAAFDDPEADEDEDEEDDEED